MTGINTGKVLVGGLVAGIVMLAVDMASSFLILMEDMTATMARLGLDAAAMESPGAMATWVVVDVLFGVLLVFTYAAMRPRFGVGVKTAMIAGLTIFFAVGLVMYFFVVMGVLTMGLFVKNSVCALVGVLLASVAGAAVYKE